MMLRVDTRSPVPVYEQIRTQITRLAVAGQLPSGSRLPPIRQLASDLGIAKGTVARAYEMLENTLVVESRGSKGTFVRDAIEATDNHSAALSAAAEAFVVIAHQAGITEAEAMAALAVTWREFGDRA